MFRTGDRHGKPDHSDTTKYCAKGDHEANPYGGVQVSPQRWMCALCWRRPLYASNRKKS